MDTTRDELGANIARRRYWAEIGLHREPKPIAGETSDEAIARGCRYTFIGEPVVAPATRPKFNKSDFPRRVRARRHHDGGFCPADLRCTAEEFDALGIRAKPHTLAALRSVAVDGRPWAEAAKMCGLAAAYLRSRYYSIRGGAR